MSHKLIIKHTLSVPVLDQVTTFAGSEGFVITSVKDGKHILA